MIGIVSKYLLSTVHRRKSHGNGLNVTQQLDIALSRSIIA